MSAEPRSRARSSAVAGIVLALAAAGGLWRAGLESAGAAEEAPASTSTPPVEGPVPSAPVVRAEPELPPERLAEPGPPEPVVEAAVAVDSTLELARLRAEHDRERAAWSAEREDLRRRIVALETELVRAGEDELRREQQWLEFTRVIASLTSGQLSPEELARVLRGPARETEAEAARAEAAAPADPVADEARRRRDREVFLALRSLFVAEQVDGMELLEAGTLREGATGPVVLRLADPWGRPVGTLTAERLRLEGSRAGRTLTLVLEEGAERLGADRAPFDGAPSGSERGGERRIVLPGVDPAPWIEAMPELFGPQAKGEVLDDGRWNPTLVQAGLNELLERDAGNGHYRLAALGGVRDGYLRDVRLDEYGAGGRLERRLFADRLAIELQERGVLLLLEDGVQMREGRRLPFLENRYRIFLPRADHAEWRAMGLPGIAYAKDSPLAHGSDAPLPAALRPGR